MSEIEIFRQQALTRCAEDSTISIFGKLFDPAPKSSCSLIVVHEDFPLINEADLEGFIEYARQRRLIVMSGRHAKIHPYRLMYIDDEGYDAFCVDIPQEVRGNRHTYPEIYEFVPALIAVPSGSNLKSALDHKNLDMFFLPENKLLDQSILTERLLISAIIGNNI